MLINHLLIKNFKIYKNSDFDFKNKKVIILSGENGFGKTTVLDAIEWCLTGSIGRIKTTYENRNTTQQEKKRVVNHAGIIKNNAAGEKDKIEVIMKLNYKNQDIIVSREQMDDDLYAHSVLKIQDENGENLNDIEVKQFFNDINQNKGKFYHTYVCDSDKTTRFFDKSRKELREVMSDFIEPQDNILEVINLLEQELNYFTVELKDKIITYEKSNQTKIKSISDKISYIEGKMNDKILKYPNEVVYENENVKIEELTENELSTQLNRLIDITKTNSKRVAEELKSQLIIDSSIKQLSKLKIDCVRLENSFKVALESGYLDENALDKVNEQIKENSSKKRKYKRIFKDSNFEEKVLTFDLGEKEQDVAIVLKSLREDTLQVKKEIESLEKGNALLAAMSNLVKDKKAYIDYRNEGNKVCPLCGGTDGFLDAKDEELCREASEFIENQKSTLVELKSLQDEKTKYYLLCKEQFQDMLMSEIILNEKEQNKRKESCIELQSELNDYCELFKKYHISIDGNYLENLQKLIDEKMSKQLSRDILKLKKQELSEYFQIIEYRDCQSMTQEELGRFLVTVKDLNIKDIKENSTYEILNNKVVAIKNIRGNFELAKLNQRKREYEWRSRKIEELKNENEARIKTCRGLKNKLQTEINDYDNAQLKSVGKQLYLIYQKLAKHTMVNNIIYQSAKTASKDAGASFVDENGKNIFNILSHGQLNIFMLSYFIANMVRIKNKTILHTYFYDDMTNFLDDMNELAFIDFIKYQLSNNDGIMEQFFFTTCNRNLEQIMRHKFTNFDISIVDYKFTTGAEFKSIN